MKPAFIGALIVLVAVMPVHAGGYVGQHCLLQPVAGFGYGQALNGHYGYGYYKQQILYVPGYQVGIDPRLEAVAKKAAKEARDEALSEFRAELTDLQAQVQGKISFEFGAKGGASASSSTGGSPVTGGEGLARFQAIVNTSGCTAAQCHSPTGSEKDFDLTDLSRLSNADLLKTAVYIHRGKMPPKGKGEPVNAEDAEWAYGWASDLD